MDTSRRAPRYDLFKLVIAILLLLLFICLLLWIPGNSPQPGTPTSTPFPPTETPTANETPTSAPPTEPLPPSATATSSDTSTATPIPIASPTATQIPTLPPTPIPTPIPSPTHTSVPAPSSTPTTYTCDSALSRSHLQVGGNARIVRRLNFRSSPGIQNNWLRTNLPGLQVEVLDGPVCLPYSNGAYVWWQIKLPDGQVGWSAEISLLGRFYFMEPRP